MQITYQNRQAGMTLLELMIAITLGLLTTAAVAYLFISASSQARFDDQASGIQENGRFTMHFLADDLRMANFWGFELQPRQITNATQTVCGTSPYRWVTGASAEGGIELISAASWPSGCQTSGTTEAALNTQPKAGTNMLLIKRVSGTPVGEPDDTVSGAVYESGKPFLLVGTKDSEMVVGNGSNRTLSNSEYLWEFMPRVYYVSANDKLCRKVLSNSTTFTTECLLEGVEDMRFLFGIDTNSDDGLADVQTIDPASLPAASSTFNPYNFAVSARVCLLLRSRGEVRGIVNDKVYSICGNDDIADNEGDEVLRRVFEKSVSLRNTAALRLYN